ncbi:hypothetical protein DDE82_006879 [Stemphylium lycopersici]|nr:hypothetical protein DDE82_006879 [Stemphylium lycopersici]
MISVGILDGDGLYQARRRAPRYRLLALVVAICLAVFTVSFVSHALWCMMNSDNVVEGTVTLEVLEKTGWEEDVNDQGSPVEWRNGLGTAGGLLNIDNEFPGTWWHENRWTDDGGNEHEPTLAVMGNIVNGVDGYIIAGNNIAPWDAAKSNTQTPIPVLPTTKWTDVVANQWKKHAPAGSDLKRVFRSAVAYIESKKLIETALEMTGESGDLDQLSPWPGVDFTPGNNPTEMPMDSATEAFMGLLGSAHVAGSAYLVIQYRAIFGKKRINKITVWDSPTKPAPNMLIHMEDLS